MRGRMVGAMSPSLPPERNVPTGVRETMTSGTGLVVCAVSGFPSSSSFCSTLPWSEVTISTPLRASTACSSLPSETSIVSIAEIVAGQIPVCPTMSALA